MRALLPLSLVAAAVLLLPGCSAIGTIFKGGVWVGVIGVVVVVAVLGLIMSILR